MVSFKAGTQKSYCCTSLHLERSSNRGFGHCWRPSPLMKKELLARWSHKEEKDHPLPLIFKALSALPKENVPSQTRPKLNPVMLLCWTVESIGESDSATWNDSSLHQSWIEYDALNAEKPGVCYITGDENRFQSIILPNYVIREIKQNCSLLMT